MTVPAPGPPRSRFESFGEGGGGARGGDPLALSPPLPPEPPLYKHAAPNVIRNPPSGDLPARQETSTGLEVRVAPDGAIRFRNPPPVGGLEVRGGFVGLGVGIAMGGKMDLTEVAMAAAGQDPYAYEKHRIAEATREERLCLATQDRERRKREALFRLREQMQAILRAPGLSPADKRAHLFELWDDCAGGGDDELRLAEAARATVLAFIRRSFPPDGPHPYAAAELASLNRRRRSPQPFDPYGG